MKQFVTTFSLCLCILSFGMFSVSAQETNEVEKKQGHTNTNKFRQLYQEFSTPNQYRSASGAPGPAYYQQRADYVMDIKIDDEKAHLYGDETITYTNFSPDVLDYLWVQLDQNMRAKDSKSPLIESGGVDFAMRPGQVINNFTKEPFDGGFNIESVTDSKGNPLTYYIHQTMMRVELPKALKTGDKFEFKIKWNYKINNHVTDGGRSGYEYFPEDDNRAYVIAQFYPRMAVYNDVEGWQNSQFWGRDEFALPFGTFEVNITVPEDHIMEATGMLQNRKEVYSSDMLKRYEQAKKSYDKPVIIATQDEAIKREKTKAKKTKTWKFKADYVRDFGFATSRKYILDMMAVKMDDGDKMAVSLYAKEGNPLWEQWSTRAVASTLKTYSRMTFDYPYHKAVSVHAQRQGMEYPMICWNYGRPDKDGNYSDRVKFGMISVIIHEIGHNYFPMIVNSDERQWTWMDEGLNTFLQYVAEQDFGEAYPEALGNLEQYPSRRGPAKLIVPYMSGNQDFIAPIMSKGLNTYQFGNNAYGKPATALNILRETVMGRELFDYAFKTYSQRWMFKHPTPEDFFRTMEDASAFDLDWFWRGWFYTTDWTDMGVESVKEFYLTDKPNAEMKAYMQENNINASMLPDLIYMVARDSEDFDEQLEKQNPITDIKVLSDYVKENYSADEQRKLKLPKYIYEIAINKPGGLVMPIIIEYTFEDGSTERIKHPAEIWRLNDHQISLEKKSDKKIVKISIDPDEETADVDTSNNHWPREAAEASKFDQFRGSN